MPMMRVAQKRQDAEIPAEEPTQPCLSGRVASVIKVDVEDNPTHYIGQNLRRLRTKRGLSLERLSKLSNVSRAMLSQIELVQSIPTIGVVWRLTKALGVPFSALLSETASARDVILLRRSNSKVLHSQDGGFSSRALYPVDEPHQVEFYELELAGYREELAEAHASGTKEYLVVVQGTVEIGSRGQSHVLYEGDAISFAADVAHSYRNVSGSRALMYLVMTYATPLG
jgi:transcriptional regulator with XRE-family HTH domain